MQPRSLLVGPRVRLDSLTEDDLDALVEMSTDIPSMRLGQSNAAAPFSAAQWKARLASLAGSSNDHAFAIRRVTEPHTMLGKISLAAVDHRFRNAEFGMQISSAHQRQGYGTEALELLLAYAFDELNLYRVGLGTFSYNTGAIAMYERMGFVHEGSLRSWGWRDGQPFDLVMMATLEPEYRSRTAAP